MKPNESGLLGQLKGILPPREPKTCVKSPLENLLGIHNSLEKDFRDYSYYDYLHLMQNREVIRSRIIGANCNYDEKDIRDLVLALATNECKNQSLTGAFTGGLASLLAEKRHKEGRVSVVDIDLQGMKFDYLLFNPRYIDILRIKNASGNLIGSTIATFGKAGIVVFEDISGHSTREGIALRGYAGLVLFNEIKGDYTGQNLRFGGNVGILGIDNVHGFLGWEMCKTTANEFEKIKKFASDSISKYSFSDLSHVNLFLEIKQFRAELRGNKFLEAYYSLTSKAAKMMKNFTKPNIYIE